MRKKNEWKIQTEDLPWQQRNLTVARHHNEGRTGVQKTRQRDSRTGLGCKSLQGAFLVATAGRGDGHLNQHHFHLLICFNKDKAPAHPKTLLYPSRALRRRESTRRNTGNRNETGRSTERRQ